ncbi:MAG: hypothetical protein AAGE61_15425 [Pseudomonadota bacterium]
MEKNRGASRVLRPHHGLLQCRSLDAIGVAAHFSFMSTLLRIPALTGYIVFSALGVMATIASADHQHVEPFDLYVAPPEAGELSPDAAQRLDDPVPIVPLPSPLEKAQQQDEQERIEDFKRKHSAERDRLPKLEGTRTEKLDQLFVLLGETNSEKMAKQVENEIQKLWMQSGSDTIDLFMRWAAGAAEKKEYGKALDFLDNVTVLQPGYAEAFNQRATIFYLKKDYARSIADVQRTLALEPRHFGALTGLGLMLQELGNEAEALDVYNRALELHPHLGHVKSKVDTLAPKVLGRDA